MTYRIADYADLLLRAPYYVCASTATTSLTTTCVVVVSVLHTEYGVLRTTFLIFSLFAEVRDNYADAILSVSSTSNKESEKICRRPCSAFLADCGWEWLLLARDAKRGSLDSHPLRKSHEAEVLGDSISAPILARLDTTTYYVISKYCVPRTAARFQYLTSLLIS